jgi:hypothetical protein
MVEPLQPRREGLLRHVARRAAAGSRRSRTAYHHFKKLEGFVVKLGLPARGVRVQGCVIYVLHPPWGRSGA